MPQSLSALATLSRTKKLQPVCPACGGLECLCRPRFFAGQLLTESDLNLLERYVIEKNKLHNRYVHGWGVACGLEVLCNACKGFVTVTAGYALSPCGDDIVVCREETVNVCELVTNCKEEKQWDCEPAFPRNPADCAEQQEWVLYLCYDEKPSRGVAALRGSSATSSRCQCSCGGSSDCGCGCQRQKPSQSKTSYQPKQTQPLPECEPTVTCEGYSFQIRKAPPKTRSTDPGKLVTRIADCLKEVVEFHKATTTSAIGAAPTLSSVNTLRQDVITLVERHGITRCDLYGKALKPLPFQTQGNGTIDNNNGEVEAYFTPLLVEIARECICSALLPPCPDAIEDNCVPLGRLTLNLKDGCEILRICNWEDRRTVPTVPGLAYWFGAFLKPAGVNEFLVNFCCDTRDSRTRAFIPRAFSVDKLDTDAISEALKQQIGEFLKNLLPK